MRTGCRIHFGLMELLESAPGCFAGLGVMLDLPQLHLRIRHSTGDARQPSREPVVPGLDTNSLSYKNTAEYRQRIDEWLQAYDFASIDTAGRAIDTAGVEVEVKDAYPLHCGLGSGTQLASLLTVAGELIQTEQNLSNQWHDVRQVAPHLNVCNLSRKSGRGRRSFIGMHGFLHGNLILDSGLQEPHWRERPDASRTQSFPIPEAWKFVLLRSAESSNITGEREQAMMGQLSGQPNKYRERMWKNALECCQAAQRSDFECYADSLELYLDRAASLFSTAQGGRYNGPRCQEAADAAQALGLRAVGQSSWGPTVFGSAPDSESATWAAQQLIDKHPDWNIQVASAQRNGAQVRYIPDL